MGTYAIKDGQKRRLDRHERIDKGHFGTLPDGQAKPRSFLAKLVKHYLAPYAYAKPSHYVPL